MQIKKLNFMKCRRNEGVGEGIRMRRAILHSDANCFYAAVEMLLDPSLRGRPVAVCGCAEERHGIVLAKSEAAKRAGVKTGQANHEARRACPGLILVPPHYDQYVKFSGLLKEIYLEYTNLVEPYGMDECWLDVTDSGALHGSGERIAQEIRLRVREELGITVSIGVSFNKVLAKLGSDMKKPDAVTVLGEDNWKERVWPLPVSELIFVGAHTAQKLMRRNVHTIGQLAACDLGLLRSWLGKNGHSLWILANGLDESRVMPDGFQAPLKSLSHGITCSRDLHEDDDVWRVMLELSQDIGHRLRKNGLAANGAGIAIRKNDLEGIRLQRQLPFPTQSPLEIARAGWSLFEKNYRWDMPVRAVVLSTHKLERVGETMQLDAFGDAEGRMRRERLEGAIEEIRARFGKDAIRAASLLEGLPVPDDDRHSVRMPGMMYR